MFDIYRINNAHLLVDLWQRGDEVGVSHLGRPQTIQVVERLQRIVARGKATGIFRPDIDVERLFCHSVAVTAGCISSAEVMSNLFARDYCSDSALNEWRRYCADYIIRALEISPDSGGRSVSGPPPEPDR
jgi:hypothetical protein